MKKTVAIILTLLFAKTIFLSMTFAEDYTRWELPEGAKYRLGKGKIDNFVERFPYQFSPGSSKLFVFSSIGVWIYDVQTGKELGLVTKYLEKGNDYVVLSPDYKTLAVMTNSSEHNQIELWDLHTDELRTTFENPSAKVYSVAFHPGGQMLVSGDSEGVIRLWNIETGVNRQLLRLNKAADRVGFSLDGQLVMISSDKVYSLCDTETGKIKITLKGAGRFNRISFIPESKLLLGTSNKEIRIWDTESGKIKTTLGVPGWNKHYALSPDGKTIASAGGNDYKVDLWNLQTGQLENSLTGDPKYVKMIMKSDAGSKIVDYATKSVESIAFSPDGHTLAVSSDDEIVLWDPDTGLPKFSLTGEGTFYKLLYSTDGKTLVARSHAYKNRYGIYLWNIDTTDIRKLVLRHVITDHNRDVHSVSFSPDGETLATGHEYLVRLWDPVDGKLKALCHGHPYQVRVQSVAFSPDGNKLANLSISIQSSDGIAEILLRDVATGKYQVTLKRTRKESQQNVTRSLDIIMN